MKRVVNLLVVLVSVLGFNISVLAADTLQDKINSAGVNGVVTLDKDYTENIVIEEGQSITIDLGEFTLKGANDHTIKNKGTLTIKGNGTVTSVIHNMAPIYNEGTMTIESGFFTRNNTASNTFYVLLNHGKMTINGGVFSVDGGISSLIDNGWYTASENTDGKMAELIINNGNFKITNNDKYIKNDDYGIMTVNGGTFTMERPSNAIIANVGSAATKETVIVNGGNFTYTGTNHVIWDYIKEVNDTPTVTVNGGTYNVTDEEATITNATLSENLQYVKDETGALVVKTKPADYTKVEEALAKLTDLDISKYTESSVDALEVALTDLQMGLDITRQAEVDAMAKAIETAFANLEKITPVMEEVPKTSDNIGTYIGIAVISLIAVILSIKALTKKLP